MGTGKFTGIYRLRPKLCYGRYFVPEREQQIQTICDLIPALDSPFNILELAYGAGLLAEALLERFPHCIVYGYDGSPDMLRHASQHLARFGHRFVPQLFNLADHAWRQPGVPLQAVVSSLTIHHLDGPEKQQLFIDVCHLLSPGGAFIIADLIEPAHELGTAVAAKAWDEAVRQRALKFDGHTAAFEKFQQLNWNLFRHPDPEFDKPSSLFDQLNWMEQAGFTAVDVHWMQAGHVIFSGHKPISNL